MFLENTLIHYKNDNAFKKSMLKLEEQGYVWDNGELPTKCKPIEPIKIKYCVFKIISNKQIQFFGTGYTSTRYPTALSI